MDEESLSDKYFLLLREHNNKVGVLAGFLRESLSLEVLPKPTYSFIGRLYRLYGSTVVFSAILSLATSDVDCSDFSAIRNFLAAVCKRIFMEKFETFNTQDLSVKARKLYDRLKSN